MSTSINDNWGSGVARPGSEVSMWIFDSNGNQRARFRDRASNTGNFVDIWERNGNAVNVRVGDFVGSDFASDALMKVINMDPSYDKSANTVSGKCWRNRAIYVYVEESQSPFTWADTYGTANNQGRFTIDTDDLGFDLEAGDKAYFWCVNPAGDTLEAVFRVP